MSEKKKGFGSLFGGKKKKSGCCDFEIVEEKECDCVEEEGCCTSTTEQKD